MAVDYNLLVAERRLVWKKRNIQMHKNFIQNMFSRPSQGQKNIQLVFLLVFKINHAFFTKKKIMKTKLKYNYILLHSQLEWTTL